MAVCIFRIIAHRQITKLAAEALAACIVYTWGAPAIPSPIAHRFDHALEPWLVREDRSPFAHGDVMGGIETQRADVTKRANIPSAIGGAERIAAILDDPAAIFLRDPQHLPPPEGVAERLGQHKGNRRRVV